MEKFDFLKEPFLIWLNEKKDIINNNKNIDIKQNTKNLLNIDSYNVELIDNCIKEIIDQGLPPDDAMKLVIDRINYYYSDWIPKSAPVMCITDFHCSNFPNALNWTLVNVYELNFFDMADIDFDIPYNQCRYCGKPDFYEHESGQREFNKKAKYCHKSDCKHLSDSTGSKPLNHSECHWGEFALKKKTLYQQMKACKKSNEEKNNLFRNFCETRLQDNLDVQWTIQTQNKKAIFHDDWY